MELFLALAAGIYLGFKVCDAYHRHMIMDILKDMGLNDEDRKRLLEHCKREVEQEEAGDQEVVNIKIEQHADCLYAFRKDTDEFLGQGPTPEALIKRLGEKMRNVRCVVSREDGAALIGSNMNWEYRTDTHKLSSSELKDQ